MKSLPAKRFGLRIDAARNVGGRDMAGKVA